VLAFEAVCKQWDSGMERLADGVCYALRIQFTCSCFALQLSFDSERRWHFYCVYKQVLLAMRTVMTLYMTQVHGTTGNEYGDDTL